jgi:hypothetical protein
MSMLQKHKKNIRSNNNSRRRAQLPFIDGQIVAMNEFGDGEIHGNRKTSKSSVLL